MISVVLPVYNVEKYIGKCLESILCQEYQDIELILVNDGSKDQSSAVIRSILEGKDVDWKLIEKENGGMASARNAGLRAAKGEYIIFIDSDDVIAKDMLKRLVTFFDEETDISFCGFRYVKEPAAPKDDNSELYRFNKRQLLESFLRRTISFVVPSMMFKRSFLVDNDLYFEDRIKFSEDQAFIWKVFLKCQKAAYQPRKMYGYYLRPSSIMTGSSYERIRSSHDEYRENIVSLFEPYPEFADIERLVMPRWQLGALYSSARLLDREQFCKLYEQMDGHTILKRLKGIGEPKAYLLGTVCSLSPGLLYDLCRRMDLNG